MPAGKAGDRLRRQDHLYDFIVEIDHNTRPRIAGRGSAVFLHLARPGLGAHRRLRGDAEGRLRQLLKNLGPGTEINIRLWLIRESLQ